MSRPAPVNASPVWDLVASAYVEEVAPMYEPYAIESLRLAAPPADSRIVDVACGPGTLAVLAAERGFSVDAIDFSPNMIDQLRTRIGAAPARITPQVGDGQALPYPDATFAAGFSMFGLMFFPDRAKGYTELRRVLLPGARAVVGSWVPLESVPVMAALFESLRSSLRELLGPDAPQPGSMPNPLSSEDACRAEMSTAFADVEVHRFEARLHYASADAFWESSERSVAPLVLLRQKLGERWHTVAERARAAIHEVAGPGPLEPVMPALLSVGTAR
jgi:SAM-dependent methyltransferase